MKSREHRNIAILAFALMVVMLGYGLVIPLFPFYIEKLGASGGHMGLLVALSALLELLFAPIWGSLSDRTGRKPILLLGIFGYGLAALLFGLSTRIWMLFASRALSGVLSSATMATALAYIGDSTSEEARSGSMGVLGAAAGLGIILGPAVGGLLGGSSLSLPFFIAAAASLLALALSAALLPESLPPAARQAHGEIKTVQFEALGRALQGPVSALFLTLFLASFGLSNFEAVFGLYAAQKLNYGPERVGAMLAVVGVASTLGKAALIGPLTRRWGEEAVIKASLLASALGFGVLLMARSYPAVLLATGVFILCKTLLRTVIIALASKRATIGQGAAMGMCNTFMSLGRVVGPIWAGLAFDLNANVPYLSGALIMLASFLISQARHEAFSDAEPRRDGGTATAPAPGTPPPSGLQPRD